MESNPAKKQKTEQESIQLEIDNLRNEIKTYSDRISDHGKKIEQLNKKLVIYLRKKYPIIWYILATPSKSNHSTHDVCYFTSEEKAKTAIGCGISYDREENVTWTYQVFSKSSDSIADIQILNLDNVPVHFPYTGW